MSLKHAFESAAADSGNANKLRPSNWGSTSTDYTTTPTHVFSGGALGSLFYRDTGQADGSNWLADVAVGSVLVSGGVGAAPAWSATPTLTSLGLSGTLTLPAMTQGGTSGVLAGSVTLVRIFQPTGAAGQNVFVGNAGNTTLSPGGGAEDLASYNTAVGYAALGLITTGKDNTAIGKGAMRDNTTGYWNTAVGVDAMRFHVSGYGNVAVGVDALDQNVSGFENTAVGKDALALGIARSNNTAIGNAAMSNGTAGDGNAALGYQALQNVTGSLNAAVGPYAGRSLVGANSNTFLGNAAGFHASQLTTASNSTGIGNGAYTTASNQVVIGNASVTNVFLGSAAGVAALQCAAITSNGGLQTFGANDSAGAGFRLVRVPNA